MLLIRHAAAGTLGLIKNTLMYTGNFANTGESGAGYSTNNQASIQSAANWTMIGPYDDTGQPYASVYGSYPWTDIHISYVHAVAVDAYGKFYTVGDDSYQQLGSNASRGYYSKRVFKQVLLSGDSDPASAGNTQWVKARGGTEFTAALDKSGRIWTCGRDDISAQCGRGYVTTDTSSTGYVHYMYNTALTPVSYPSRWPVPSYETGGQHTWIDFDAAHRYVLALDSNKRAWSWGNNGSRQCGRVSYTQNTPKLNSVPTSAPYSSSQVYAIGSSDAVYIANYTQDNNCLPLDYPGPYVSIATGAYHGAGVGEDGNLYCWGLTSGGQTALDQTTASNNYNVVFIVPLEHALNQNFQQGTGGMPTVYTDTLTNRQYVKVTYNTNAYVANAFQNMQQFSHIVPHPTGKAWKQVTCGEYYTIARDELGDLYAFGGGNGSNYGQCGTNTTTNYSTPTKVTATDPVTSAAISFIDVRAGYNTTFAIDTQKRLWAWGRNVNQAGSIFGNGDTSTAQSAVPVLVNSTPGWRAAYSGANGACVGLRAS